MRSSRPVLASDINPSDLPYLLWWTQDGEVWAVVLTFVVGLTGAVIGGAFASADAKRARKNQISDLRRASVDEDVRQLHRDFVDLMSEVDQHPGTIGQILGVDSWRDEWKKMWTPARRTSFRIRADVIPEKATRDGLSEIIEFLNDAREYSSDAFWPAPTRRSLQYLVGLLAAEGVDIISAYRRGESFQSKRTKFMKELRREEKERVQWEKMQETQSAQAADEWYTSLPEAEQKKINSDFEKMLSRRKVSLTASEESEESSDVHAVNPLAPKSALRQRWSRETKSEG